MKFLTRTRVSSPAATATRRPARSKPKKKKQTEDDKIFIKAQGDSTHYQINEVLMTRQRLKGVGKLVGDGELKKFIKMHMTVAQIQKRMKKRVTVVALILAGSLGIGFVFKSHFGGILLVGILLSVLAWIADISGTKKYFQNYNVNRLIAWATFVRMASAYLPELKTGSNMYVILQKVVPRLEKKEDQENLQRLLIEMRDDPEDSRPFLKFAHEYSVSKSAEMVMLVIQSMYLGDVNDHNIQALANEATVELSKQTSIVIEHKLKRFEQLGTKIVLCFLIPTFSYIILLVGDAFISLFQQIHL